jgi:hypothetical protein
LGTSNTWYENTYTPYSHTVRYSSSTGETIYERTYPLRKPTKRRQELEIEAGDTTALDEFLGGFVNAKE